MSDQFLGYLQSYVRHFPIDRGKNRLIQMLWGHLSSGNHHKVAALRPVRAQMNCDLSKHIQRDIFFWGTYHYEEDLLNLWIKLCKHATIIFDVGANVGIYALCAACTNPVASVYAFEPTSELAEKLRQHVKMNSLKNVTVSEVAVGRADEVGYVHTCTGGNGSNEGMNFVTTEQSNQCAPTTIRSLDSYCKEYGIPRIDLMKIDIEGGEYYALLGMRNLLSRKAIGCIFLELVEWSASRYGHSTTDIKRLLSSNGYHLYEFCSGTLNRLNPDGVHTGEANILAFANAPDVRSFPAGL